MPVPDRCRSPPLRLQLWREDRLLCRCRSYDGCRSPYFFFRPGSADPCKSGNLDLNLDMYLDMYLCLQNAKTERQPHMEPWVPRG